MNCRTQKLYKSGLLDSPLKRYLIDLTKVNFIFLATMIFSQMHLAGKIRVLYTSSCPLNKCHLNHGMISKLLLENKFFCMHELAKQFFFLLLQMILASGAMTLSSLQYVLYMVFVQNLFRSEKQKLNLPKVPIFKNSSRGQRKKKYKHLHCFPTIST